MATTTTNFGWDIPQSTDLVKDGATAIAALGQDIDTSMNGLRGGTTGQVLSKTSGTDMAFTWVTQDDANAIQNAIVDAKGDLITATANDTPARLAVGTNGQFLIADSTAATGLKWGTAAASGLNLITTQAISGVTSQSINNCFSSTYQNYVIVFSAYCATSANNPTFKLRASGTDSSANYYIAFQSANWTSGGTATGYTNNGTSWDQRPLGSLDTSSTSLSGTTMTLYSPFATTNTAFTASYLDARVGANNGAGSTGGVHNSATSYDGFTITNATAMTGTVRVYGLAN